MLVSTRKSFDKAFAKLTQKQRRQASAAIATFLSDPFAEELRNHALKGEFA